jgi:hypothetical protein
MKKSISFNSKPYFFLNGRKYQLKYKRSLELLILSQNGNVV